MVVVHIGGCPLDVGNRCGCLVVVLRIAFAAPASDVEGPVLVTVSEMEKSSGGCGGVCGGVKDCITQFVRVRGFGYAIVTKEARGSAVSDPGFAQVKAGGPGVIALAAAPRFLGVCGLCRCWPGPPVGPFRVFGGGCFVVRICDLSGVTW